MGNLRLGEWKFEKIYNVDIIMTNNYQIKYSLYLALIQIKNISYCCW